MTFEEYKKHLEQEDKPLERPLIDPIDLAGGALGSMAAKGILGAGKIAASEGASLAGKGLYKLKGMLGRGSMKAAAEEAPVLATEATKTAAASPIAEAAAEYAPVQPYSNLSEMTGKGTEYYMQPGGHMFKSVNGNMGLGTSAEAASNVLPMSQTQQAGDAVMQGIRDKIAQANSAAAGPQFGKLKSLMGGQ